MAEGKVNEMKSHVLALHELNRQAYSLQYDVFTGETVHALKDEEITPDSVHGFILPTGYKVKENPKLKQSKPVYVNLEKGNSLNVVKNRAETIDLFENYGTVASSLFGLFVDGRNIDLEVLIAQDEEQKLRSIVLGILETETMKRAFVFGTSGGEDFENGIFRTPWKVIAPKTESKKLDDLRNTFASGKIKVNALYYSADKTAGEVARVDLPSEESTEKDS